VTNDERPLRVLVAKVGLDGHDRGLRIVARILRDAGCEVIYAGLRQSPEAITAMTIEEDVDLVGVSMHNGAHLTLAPAVVDSLRAAGLDTPVVVGGIVPRQTSRSSWGPASPPSWDLGFPTRTSWPPSRWQPPERRTGDLSPGRPGRNAIHSPRTERPATGYL
jgi:methylmalonyl-CoA mutase C-terminal domain/subunit